MSRSMRFGTFRGDGVKQQAGHALKAVTRPLEKLTTRSAAGEYV
jgi:hypothetical protein